MAEATKFLDKEEYGNALARIKAFNEATYAKADAAVTALGTSGNHLTWTKGGTTNSITVPYATSAGSATKVGMATVGSITRPVYINAGTPTAITSFPEALLSWGGQNFSGNYGPIDAAMVDNLGACRTMFAKAAGIVVEYSTNGGTTWTDYGLTDTEKVALFSSGGSARIGKNMTAGGGSANHMLRVTLHTSAASVYTALNKFVIYLSTYGSSGCYCTIRCRTQQNHEDDVDTWITRADHVPVSGWSGYNVINITATTTYGNTKSTQYGEWQFIFGCTGFSGSSYYGLTINNIWGYGGVGWTIPSNMAKHGHIYAYDSLQQAGFPAKVYPQSNGLSLGDTAHRWNLYAREGNFSSAVDVGGALSVDGNTSTKGTLTVGTSSANKATTLYGTLTTSDKVKISLDGSTLGIDSNYKIGTGLKALHIGFGQGSGTGLDNGKAEGITFGTGTAAHAGIYVQSSGSYGTRMIFGTTGSYTNGAYGRVIIDSSGKVGIATMTPSYTLHVAGTVYATSFVKSSGTSDQFLKADGSVDSNTYLTTGSASNTYLPLAGGTMTGAITAHATADATVTTAGINFGSGTSTAHIGYATGVKIFGLYSAGKIALRPNGVASPNGLELDSTSIKFNEKELIAASGTSAQFVKADGSFDSTAYLYGTANRNITHGVSSEAETWSNLGYADADKGKYNLMIVRHSSSVKNSFGGTGMNYGNTLFFGGADTRAYMGVAYNAPRVVFGGGSLGATSASSVPDWYMILTGTDATTYNLTTIASQAANGNTAYNSLSDYLPLAGGTMTGAIMLGDNNVARIRKDWIGNDTTVALLGNYSGAGSSGFARNILGLAVDDTICFRIGMYGQYTLGASDNKPSYIYFGQYGYSGLNLRIGMDDTLKWGDHVIWHNGIDAPLTPRYYHNYSNGILVTTDFGNNTTQYPLIKIEGRSHNGANLYPVLTYIQSYIVSGAINSNASRAYHLGMDLGTIYLFLNSDKKFCIWFEQPNSNSTIWVSVYNKGRYNVIATQANATMPTEGITSKVTVTAKHNAFENEDVTFTTVTSGNISSTGNITTTENIGIGTTSPASRLHIVNSTYPNTSTTLSGSSIYFRKLSTYTTGFNHFVAFRIVDADNEMLEEVRLLGVYSGSAYTCTYLAGSAYNNSAMRIDGSGTSATVGIGYANKSDYKLYVNGTFRATSTATVSTLAISSTSGVNHINFSRVGGNYINFPVSTSSTQSAVCISTGGAASANTILAVVNTTSHAKRVGILNTSPSYTLDVTGIIHSTTGIFSDGYVSAYGVASSSDARLKDGISAISFARAKEVLSALKPSEWTWKKDGRRGAGMVAQEVQPILPDTVSEIGGNLTLEYNTAFAYGLAATKYMLPMVETHEEKIERLEKEVASLREELKNIKS